MVWPSLGSRKAKEQNRTGQRSFGVYGPVVYETRLATSTLQQRTVSQTGPFASRTEDIHSSGAGRELINAHALVTARMRNMTFSI